MSDLALGAAIVGDTFRNLVSQFSQELCFYRELIQNAIDAGSATVDVRITYDEARRVVVAEVIDLGCGMDGHIIDTQLTRLFSSSKEDDFTKIGKFGIGFVSVFAVNPTAVVVDTGRGGESWRVIFTPDMRFERIVLDQPTEGTRVAVLIPLPRPDLDDFIARSRETVEYWCRHADVEIRFNGERVDAPFDLDAPVKVRVQRQGTDVVAALSPQDKPFFGFYNGGITLLEGRQDWIPGVAFKLKSRYLEHTLTRDNVKHDANFDKAMKLLREVAAGELEEAFRAWLRTLEGTEASDPAQRRAAMDVARVHLARLPRDLAFLPVLGDSARLALPDLEKLAHRTRDYLVRHRVDAPARPLLTAAAVDHVTEAVTRKSIRIVACADGDGVVELLEAAGYHPLVVGTLFGLPLPCAPPPPIADLAARAGALLHACGVALKEVRFASFEYAGSCIAERPFLVQTDPAEPATAAATALVGEDCEPWTGNGMPSPSVIVNVAHPLVVDMAASRSPRLGAYLFAKLLCLADGLHPETEHRLIMHTLAAV